MRSPAARVLAVGLALAGFGCLVGCGGTGPDATAPVTPQATITPYDDAPSPVPTSPTAPPATGSTPDADPTTAVPRTALPTRLSIAAIDVRTPLVSLGLQDDDTVEVPSDPDRAGWYRYGVAPGRAGAAVILGHVDSVDGPAVFARLDSLKVGDQVTVELDTGQTVGFRVRAVKIYANADFPAKRVYRSQRRHHDLNLVTCGGVYDRDLGGYQSNVVVFTREIRTR